MSVEDRILIEYLRRSYHAADGLWFMKVEEAHGFEEALDLDRRVWEVLARIQARKARELLGEDGTNPEALQRCFELKLAADGHRYSVEEEPGAVRFRISGCPWLELLRKTERTHLALKVAEVICLTEGQVWSRQFGDAYEFEMPLMACGGDAECHMRFARKRGGGDEGP